MGKATAGKKYRFKLKMPGAFTILFFLTVIAVMLTWIVPAGSYSKLAYVNNHLQVTQPTGEKISYPATQTTLDKLHIQIDVDQFKSVDIMIFILVLGGLIGVVKASGAFESGLAALSTKTKGKEFILVFLVTVLLALGGTLCGIEEEAVAFYPILAPVFIAMGYDSLRQMLLGQLLRKEWQDEFLAW